ncbi:MAG: hypothetical protein HOW73_25805 [Polyangiaceae bacterium]|nr:hypothetical protein [Polyangiaceae bacterium]
MKPTSLLIFAMLTAAACGDDSSTGGGGSGGTPATGGSPNGGAPEGAGPQGGDPHGGNGGAPIGGEGGAGGGEGGAPPIECIEPDGAVLAVREWFVGDTSFAGAESPTAWRTFGRNIDGLTTTNDFSGHCAPNTGAAPNNAFPDGDDGIDNAFGRSIIPIVKTAFQGSPSQSATDSIEAGEGTLLFDLVALSLPDQSPVVTRLYGGGSLPAPPALDGTDCWPVTPASLTNPADITTAAVTFPESSVVANLFTSGDPVDVDVVLSVGGYNLALTVHQAVVTMVLDDDHLGATQGMISGVLDTEEFIATIHDLLGAVDPSLCEGAASQGIENQIRQASDILADGTQAPNVTCSGISVGIGFTAESVSLGGVGLDLPLADTCP